MSRRSVIIAELSQLSHNGWEHTKPVDYQPLEAKLRSTVARDLRTPKYRQRIVRDRKREASRLACRREKC